MNKAYHSIDWSDPELAARLLLASGPTSSAQIDQWPPLVHGRWGNTPVPRPTDRERAGGAARTAPGPKPYRPNPPWPAGPAPEARETRGTRLTPAAERALAMQAMRMYKTHLDLGWSPAAAAGWAANIVDESGGDPHIRERRRSSRSNRPSGYGLFQLTYPSRRRMLEEAMGIPVERSTESQQLKFRDIELNKEPGFRDLALALRRPGTAGDMADLIARDYERPDNVEAEAVERRNIANQILALQQEWRQARLRRR